LDGFMKYGVEMASGDMSFLRRSMSAGSGIKVILRILPQQFERTYSWYYRLEGFIKYGIEVASGGMIIIPVFIMVGSGVQVILTFYL
jgi:pilus assembly protein TadC